MEKNFIDNNKIKLSNGENLDPSSLGLSKEKIEKLQEILSSKEAIEKIMESDTAKAIIKNFSEG